MKENRGNFTNDAAQVYLSQEPDMQTTQLSPRLWTITDGQVRTMFIEADNSVIAFDTFGTPGKARAYRKAVAQVIDKPIKTIFYSHDHLDHTGFAQDLAPEATVIADEMCAKIIKLRAAQGQTVPTQMVSGISNELTIDGVNLQLINPGPTHGTGNISVYLAEERTLFSSDTILANAKYGFMPDYHFCQFVKNMQSLLALDWDTFIPGRYELTDRAGFERGCQFIEAVKTECQNAFAEFVPIWAYDPMYGYVSAKLKDSYGDLDGFDQHIGQMSIRIVHHYLMGGWGLEDTPAGGFNLAKEV